MPVARGKRARPRVGTAGSPSREPRESGMTTKTAVSKRLPNGQAEGGIHVHNYDRLLRRTAVDGLHSHVFKLPDGSYAVTREDGAHEHTHSITYDDVWLYGGEHFHSVEMPDGSSRETDMGGSHQHALQTRSTTFDGVHTHTVRLLDGSTVTSLLPSDQWALESYGSMYMGPAPAASEMAKRGGVHKASLSLRADRDGPSLLFKVAGGLHFAVRCGRCELDGALIDDVAKSFTVYGNRYLQPLTKRCSVVPTDHEVDDFGPDPASVGSVDVEVGTVRDNVIELFLTNGPATGALLLTRSADGWTAELKKQWVPLVLRAGVAKSGRSALPKSLEAQVPAALRYWTTKDESACAAQLQALIEMDFADDVVFTPDGFKKVVVERRFFEAVADEEDRHWTEDVAALMPVGKAVVSPFAEEGEAWRNVVEKAADAVVVLDPPDLTEVSVDDLIQSSRIAKEYFLSYPDSPEAREAFSSIGRVFKLRRADTIDRIFVASFGISENLVKFLDVEPAEPRSANVEKQVRTEWVDDLLTKATFIPVEKAKTKEERFVYGIVLEPDEVDSQGDTISAEEIRSAAHKFMSEYGNIGLQHRSFINGKVKIVESFVVPGEIGKDTIKIADAKIKAGTWLFGTVAEDNEIWKQVKAGKLTGYSIGGVAVRETEDT